MKDKCIMMKVLPASSLAFIAKAYKEWQSYVNDESYYSIIEKEIITGKDEYIMIIRYTRNEK